METKNTLQKLVLDAQSNSDECVSELFYLIHQALVRSEGEVINRYIMNGISENDVLLLVVLTDLDLSVNFQNEVLILAVQYIFRDGR